MGSGQRKRLKRIHLAGSNPVALASAQQHREPRVARLTVPGVAAGIGGAWLVAGLLRSFLFGVEPRSFAILGGAGLGVLVLAAAAAFPSIHRAMRTDARPSPRPSDVAEPPQRRGVQSLEDRRRAVTVEVHGRRHRSAQTGLVLKC